MRVTTIFRALPVEQTSDWFEFISELLLGEYFCSHGAVVNGGHGRCGIAFSNNLLLIGNKPHEVFLSGHQIHLARKLGYPKAMYYVFSAKIDANRFGCGKNEFVGGYYAKLRVFEYPEESLAGDVNGNGAIYLTAIQAKFLKSLGIVGVGYAVEQNDALQGWNRKDYENNR